MNPGKTGVLEFIQSDIKTRTRRLVSSRNLRDTIRDIAGREGKKVVVLNVPMTFPPKPISGYMVTGLLTPSVNSRFVHPDDMAEELLKAIPEYHIMNSRYIRKLKHEPMNRFVEAMKHSLSVRTAAVESFLQKQATDVFMVHFQATDVLQHKCWPWSLWTLSTGGKHVFQNPNDTVPRLQTVIWWS